jgi:pimeloyl-ACP methyl ester carboxylesterase
MGARLTALLAIAHPERVGRIVLGGLAENIVRGLENAEAVAEGLMARDPAEIADPQARAFRLFADQTASDRRALAACMTAQGRLIPREQLARIVCPTLVVAGERDEIAGRVEPLVAALPNARGVVLPRRDHMKAVGDPQFKAVVREFLEAFDLL